MAEPAPGIPLWLTVQRFLFFIKGHATFGPSWHQGLVSRSGQPQSRKAEKCEEANHVGYGRHECAGRHSRVDVKGIEGHWYENAKQARHEHVYDHRHGDDHPEQTTAEPEIGHGANNYREK
jgi:hypothetical protein